MNEECDNRGGACTAMRETGQCECHAGPRCMCYEGPKYILWDPRDGDPRRAEDGEFISDGLIGRIGPDNVYLTTYADWPSVVLGGGTKAWLDYRDLEVGQRIRNVVYRLSGQKGVYDVWRVA